MTCHEASIEAPSTHVALLQPAHVGAGKDEQPDLVGVAVGRCAPQLRRVTPVSSNTKSLVEASVAAMLAPQDARQTEQPGGNFPSGFLERCHAPHPCRPPAQRLLSHCQALPSPSMDLNLGKHCEVPECHQLDFLPFKCAHCAKTLCLEVSALARRSAVRVRH
jgi:hypothetical protein